MWQLRSVQQSLAVLGVLCKPVEPYKDGRTRYAVWPAGRKYLAKFTDDLDEAYIMGLKGFEQ